MLQQNQCYGIGHMPQHFPVSGDVLSPTDDPCGGLPQLRPLHARRDSRDQQHSQVLVPADHEEGP